nr:zinc finger, CCHC-type, retrotransposon Gag domain protein [Tanacetum cinerariifolium]
SFKTLCLLNYALMKRHDYDVTVFFTKRGVTIMMVNTRTDADLSAVVQNALHTLLPQIHAEIREEFRTSSGPSDAGGNPPPVTIHTWLERFNKQKPRSFEKATAPVDAENWISQMEKIFDVMGCGDAFKTRLAVSTLNHLMCMSYTDVAQVANAARNYEILHERDDDDAERPDKRQKSGDRHQPSTQHSSHRNHGHNNNRHGSNRRGGGDNHRSNNNYSGNNNRLNFKSMGQQSNRYANSGSQQSRGPSEGYFYPVCTTCGRRHSGECRRAVSTCFKCGQVVHLQKDCKKNTTASTSGQADKKPGSVSLIEDCRLSESVDNHPNSVIALRRLRKLC